MTEADWLKCQNCNRMLEYIPYKVSKRKWRLAAVAFCRSIWHLLPDDGCQHLVESTEKCINGAISSKDLKKLEHQIRTGFYHQPGVPSGAWATTGAASYSKSGTGYAAMMALHALREAGGKLEDEERKQCDLIRDILGYPYRSYLIAPSVLTWNGATVVNLAQSAYDERIMPSGELDKGRLAILADALEDAGCTDAAILDHLRGPGPHVCGCWVVDLLLGKS